jgi:hypothetical protein
MAENFGKNFIPQKRVDPGRTGLKIYNTVDTFTAIALIVSATVLFISIGIFGSGFFIDKQIESLQKEVSGLSSEFNSKEVNELASLDRTIAAASTVVGQHTSITDIRTFLEEHTQSKVQILKYSFKEGVVNSGEKTPRSLVIKGEALNYNTLANQQNIYNNDSDITSIIFSGITPTENGTVEFTATIDLKDSAFSYNALSQ